MRRMINGIFFWPPGLYASFDIESYALNNLEISASGGIGLNVGMQISTSQSYNKEYEIQVSSTNLIYFSFHLTGLLKALRIQVSTN